jgi:hypothetical protein
MGAKAAAAIPAAAAADVSIMALLSIFFTSLVETGLESGG